MGAGLRDKEKVDVVVIAMHMGIEEDLRTGHPSPSNVPNENAAIAIARQVPGVDVILMGHTHREVKRSLICERRRCLRRRIVGPVTSRASISIWKRMKAAVGK